MSGLGHGKQSCLGTVYQVGVSALETGRKASQHGWYWKSWRAHRPLDVKGMQRPEPWRGPDSEGRQRKTGRKLSSEGDFRTSTVNCCADVSRCERKSIQRACRCEATSDLAILPLESLGQRRQWAEE